MGTKVTATYITSNGGDTIHLSPHGIAFQVTPELLRAYLAPDVDWGDWKPSLHDDGVAEPVESYGEPIAVRHDTEPVEVLEPETWAHRLAFFEVEADPVTRIDWDTTSDPSNPGWVARQGRLSWPVQGCELDATDAELVDAADAWAPAGVYVAAVEADRTEAPAPSGERDKRDPWKTIHEVAASIHRLYDPGDDSEDLGRCDLQLVQDACYAGRMALQGARDTPEGDRDAAACEAVSELLRALHRVLTGMSGDVRDLAASAGELAGALARMHGPEVNHAE